jgi:hypothetical protein
MTVALQALISRWCSMCARAWAIRDVIRHEQVTSMSTYAFTSHFASANRLIWCPRRDPTQRKTGPPTRLHLRGFPAPSLAGG